MRLTVMSPLVVLALPLVAYAQSVVVSTDAYGTVYTSTVYETTTSSSVDYGSSTIYTSYTTGSGYDASTTSIPPTTTYVPAIQTVPYTGQAILVGTCNIAQFTLLTFPDGNSIEVPLVGCSDERPECCPSLNFTRPQETGSSSSSSTSSWTGTTPSPTPTGVISMLSQAPLSICPSDFVDIDPVCCPSGFTTYGQSIIGNLPCVSTLTTTIEPGSAVLASITSMVAASLESASTTATAAPTISVVVSQVFSLGLPCEDNEESNHTHLGTGAKIGIGVGVGVAGLLLIGFFWACLAVRHRRRAKMKRLEAANTAAGGAIRPESTAYASAQQPEPKHISMATTMAPSAMGSPAMQQHQPYSPTGYSPAFGYGAPQTMPMPHDPYASHQPGPYGMGPQQIHQPYPVYPQSQSPPPFYHSQSGNYVQEPYNKTVPAEVGGDEVQPAPRRESVGRGPMDTRSHTTSTTVVGSGSQHGAGGGPAAELSSHGSRQGR